MDGNAAIMRLRARLSFMGLDPDDIDSRCSEAALVISNGIAELVYGALQEAESLGLEMGATDFVAELNVRSAGSNFEITTDSGRTDFSNPPWPMLPGLLKNAKISKDGHRYKRIPMGSTKSVPKDSMRAAEQRQAVLEEAKTKINDQIVGGAVAPDVNRAARDFASAYKATRSPSHKDRKKEPSGGNVKWVTASDAPGKAQWIYPAKHQDTAGIIMEVNNKLQQSIQVLIDQVVGQYGE